VSDAHQAPNAGGLVSRVELYRSTDVVRG